MNIIGLTKQEERTYQALLELGTTTTGPLCKKANIASSHIYHALDKLINKGLVSYQEKNNRKEFYASPPKIAETAFDKRIQELEEEKQKIKQQKKEHLELLKNFKPEIKQGINYQYFENITGIKAMYEQIIQEFAKTKDTFYIFSHKPSEANKMLGFYNKVHQERIKHKREYKAIFDTTYKNVAKKRKLSTIKFIDIKNEAAWGIYADLFFIYHLGKKPYAILIRDKIIAQSFKFTFQTIWK